MFSKRLNLQQLKYPLDEQAQWLNDPRNTAYSEQRHYTHDKVSCAEYITKCSMFWGIQDVDSGEWIGTISAHVDDHNEIADVGILLHYEYVNQGYGKEAWNTVLDFLLKKKNLRKVEAGCMANNLAMRKLCVGSGMFFEGERKNHFLYEGTPVGLVMYGKWR